MILHRGTLHTHRCHYKQRCFYKGMRLRLPRRTFTYRCLYFAWFPTADTHFARKSSESRCQNRNFTDRNAVRAKGLHEHKHNWNFTVFLTIEPHLVREDLRKAIQTQKNVLSPQFWRSRHIWCERGYIRKTIETQKSQFRCSLRGSRRVCPHCNFTSILDNRHFVWEGCVFFGHQSTLPCRHKRKCRKLFWRCRCFQEVDLHLHLYICHFTPAYINV